MKISYFDLSQKVLVVAEIGNNHEGDFEKAHEMVRLAAEAGADAVKFQTFVTERYVSSSETHRCKQLKGYELTYDQFAQLAQSAKENGVIFLTTPFDIESADAIDEFVPAYKISSGDNVFWPLIKHISKKDKPILMSTGLIDMNNLNQAVEIIKKHSGGVSLKDKLLLLHCISSYPASNTDLNLLTVKYLKDQFDIYSGYSDHSLGTDSCIVSVALGARVIEKHFTYRKENQTFNDHKLSADPPEFKAMVDRIREVETMLGRTEKKYIPAEEPLQIAARRSCAAKADLAVNSKINWNDITWVRPATGVLAGQEEDLIGKITTRDMKQGEIFTAKDVK